MQSEPFDSLPPHSLDVEQKLLGSLVLDPTQAREIVPSMRADDFFLTDHKILFAIIARLTTAGRPVDAVILRDELKSADKLTEIGGPAYLMNVIGSVPNAAHANEYASRTREYAARRALQVLCGQAEQRAQDGNDDAAAIATALADGAGEVMQRRSAGTLIAWDQLIDSTYEQIGSGGLEKVRFGWHELDHITGGLGMGETVVLAARPSMGKSTAARNIGLAVAMADEPVGMISLEEGPEKIARNMIAALAGVENHRLRNSTNISADEYRRLAAATAKLRALPITVTRSARTIDEIRAAATTMRARHGIKLLIVDHLSRIRAPGRDIYQQVTAASGAMSDLVRDLNVAGLILAQLNRGVEHRDSQRPTMSDLRDSGAIEQDADGILMLHREDYYRYADPAYLPDQIAEMSIVKWRDGVRGKTVKLRSELKFQRFVDPPFPDAPAQAAAAPPRSNQPPFEPHGRDESEA